MVRNGKFFVPPEGDDDFKALFQRVTSAGVGRPVDRDGVPQGSWTPQLLADAIGRIEANRDGVDLRTVQLWFQDNDKGVSADNIRWLARIFGCDDPAATSAWQAALSAANARLVARRRRKGKANGSGGGAPDGDESALSSADLAPATAQPADVHHEAKSGRSSLARKTEALFGLGSPLNLPATVFAGAVALGFLAYFLEVHSVTYARSDGVAKQVGFLWAPNWTLLFMILLPLFLAFVAELLVFWRREGRLRLLVVSGMAGSDAGWARQVEASSATYWVVFVVCVGFAGVFQWFSTCLITLLQGRSDYAIDWGLVAIVRPDVVSVPEAAALTGLAFLYMSMCFYLLFAGLILLHSVAHDLWEIRQASRGQAGPEVRSATDEVALRVMRAVFRCTACGLLIAICMKLQSSYLVTSAENIWIWLVDDARSVLGRSGHAVDRGAFSMPTHYTSLLTVLAIGFVFLYAAAQVGRGLGAPLARIAAAVAALVAAYLLIDVVPGFSLLLAGAVAVAIYGLIDPGLGPSSHGASGGR